MTLYHNSKHKLRNILRTIDSLLDGDFPFDAGKRALLRLKNVFIEFEKKIDRAKRLSDEKTIEQLSSNINVKIIQVLPILGFILRSTNVRNAFELLDPLQSLADLTLQGNPELILSSEWDYVPFAYPQSLKDLRSFVLIGLPASEAASALLVPLAGHELGHAVWRNLGIEGSAHLTLQQKCQELYRNANNLQTFKRTFSEYDPDDMVAKEILPETIARSVEYAVFQAEEIFCDLFAYAVFGEGYVHAFSYILAPGSSSNRRSKYPSYETRISTIRKVAEKEGITLPDTGELNFSSEIPLVNARDRFILRMAEESVAEVTNGLWSKIDQIIHEGNVCRPKKANALAHLKEFQIGIPAHRPECLGDIINAGWKYYDEILNSREEAKIPERLDCLNEMLLKSIEVLEFRRRAAHDPDRKKTR